MEAWRQFLIQLEQEFGADAVNRWAANLKVARFDAGNLYLEAADSLQAGWFEEHVRPLLKKSPLLNNNGRPVRIHIAVPHFKKEASPETQETTRFSIQADTLDPELTLDTFHATPENTIPFRILSEFPSPFNPIFLYGPEGSGKTHLLMGAAHLLRKKGKRVFYVRAETFTEHVVQAIRLGMMQEFRKVYRDIDVLIVDGIHIFSRKAATQEEFFHTFNTLHTLGHQILLSANAAPSALKEIEPRLISRFEWGISIGLAKTDPRLLIEKKAALWNFPLSPQLIDFFLEKFPKNPLQPLQALVLRAGPIHKPIAIEIAKRILSDLLEKEEQNALTFDQIIKGVAAHFGIRGEDLLGKSQTREFALPRQIAMYLCREKLQLPYQKIGEQFGRDHSTVMSSFKLVQKAIEDKKRDILDAVEHSTQKFGC